MKWFKWFAAAHNVNFQTRESLAGEKRIGKYKVDGFIPVAERDGPNFKFCDHRACLYCYHESAKLAGTVLEFEDAPTTDATWVGTYFTDELNLALSHGYRVDKLIGMWHWDDDQWTDHHFKGYINTFVRMKTEANGWKKEILNAADPEKAKDEFIEAYRLKGIHLRKDKIRPNPGLKEYAKLGANNLWGRFGLRPNIPKVEIVSKPGRLYEMLDGPNRDRSRATYQ